MDYKIRIDVFEGPMDLLLHLINKDEIDIYDIPINYIAEQFVEFISKMEELNLSITSEFLVMAATLLEIKSRMLLPTRSHLDDECLEEEEDPRAELVRRLIEYKKYKAAADDLRLLEEIQYKVYYKPREDLTDYQDEQLEIHGLKLEFLLKSLNNILSKRSKENNIMLVNEIQREEYTLEKCIEIIKERINTGDSVAFSNLIGRESTRSEIITYFLSILELISTKYINYFQKADFSDLIISKRLEESQ